MFDLQTSVAGGKLEVEVPQPSARFIISMVKLAVKNFSCNDCTSLNYLSNFAPHKLIKKDDYQINIKDEPTNL